MPALLSTADDHDDFVPDATAAAYVADSDIEMLHTVRKRGKTGIKRKLAELAKDSIAMPAVASGSSNIANQGSVPKATKNSTSKDKGKGKAKTAGPSSLDPNITLQDVDPKFFVHAAIMAKLAVDEVAAKVKLQSMVLAEAEEATKRVQIAADKERDLAEIESRKFMAEEDRKKSEIELKKYETIAQIKAIDHEHFKATRGSAAAPSYYSPAACASVFPYTPANFYQPPNHAAYHPVAYHSASGAYPAPGAAPTGFQPAPSGVPASYYQPAPGGIPAV